MAMSCVLAELAASVRRAVRPTTTRTPNEVRRLLMGAVRGAPMSDKLLPCGGFARVAGRHPGLAHQPTRLLP